MWNHEIIPAPGSGRQLKGDGQGKDAVLTDPAHYPASAVCAGTRTVEGRPDEVCAQLVQRDSGEPGGEWYHVAPRNASAPW